MRAATLVKSFMIGHLLYGRIAIATGTIDWAPCEKQNASIPIECGTLTVPLDYTVIASGETLDLQLVRVKAKMQPSRGSIIFNPGGPGDSGRNFITAAGGNGYELSNLTGGHHDLVSFDSRGTGQTIPFDCALSDSTQESFALMPPNLTESFAAMEEAISIRRKEAKICSRTQWWRGELIGTAFVARDMMRIVDALGEDGLLHYWGISYGTVLGTTTAAMFPERMGRVVLDGVVNPTEYWSGRSLETLTDTEATYAGFFTSCMADAGLCSLSDANESAMGLRHDNRSSQYASLRFMIWSLLYSPQLWPMLAEKLDSLEEERAIDDSKTYTADLLKKKKEVFPSLAAEEAVLGIRCGDSKLRSDDVGELMQISREAQSLSPTFGDVQTDLLLTCALWKMRAKERYTAGFHGIKTANPILFVGNTFDPVTPLVSARNATAAFPGSALLQCNAYGHSSLSQPSLCAARVIQEYFADGILPSAGKICTPSVSAFHTSAQEDEFYRSLDPGEDGSEEDAHLLAAAAFLGDEMLSKIRIL